MAMQLYVITKVVKVSASMHSRDALIIKINQEHLRNYINT